MEESKILIIIPAFNEGGNIAKTVQEVLSLPYPVTVLVVDDGSGDETAKEAKDQGCLVVSLPFNVGIGGAVQTGFQYALKHRFSIAVQVDGDGQHDVAYLHQLLEPIQKNQVDMTIGSRFIPPFIGYRSSFVRRIGIHFFSCLLSFLSGCKVTDPTSGFRACNSKTIRTFAYCYPHDFPEPEAIMIAKRRGLTIKEIPVQMRKRKRGHSSIRYIMTLYYMIKVTFAIFLNLIKTRTRETENGN